MVAPLRILCIYAAFYSCQVLVGHLLLWTGRFRANMWCSVLAATLLPAGFYVGTRWGLSGIAWVWVIGFPLVNLPAFVIAFRAIGINGWQWLNAFVPALVGCAAMVGAVLATRAVLPATLPLPIYTVACVGLGIMAYLATLLLLFRKRLLAVRYFLNVIRRKDAGAELPDSTGARGV